MKFNFDWNFVSNGAPYITVSEYGLGFNIQAISLLDNAKEVAIGFDAQNMAIGIKKIDDKRNVKTFKFFSRIKNGWVRIGCKDFVKYLSSLTGIVFKPAKRYTAKFDPESQVLYISLSDKSQDSCEVADEEEEGI